MKSKALLLSAIAIFTINHAQARDAGYYDLIESKTVLELSESAEKEVEQDRIKAVLRITKDATEATDVQNHINKNMQSAVDLAKKFTDIKVSTGSYRVNQKYDSKLRRNVGWSGSQEIILDTKNKESIYKVVEKLQKDGFAMSAMNYYLSREKAASYRTELIKEALQRVQERSQSIAEQLKAKKHHIGSINVSNQNQPQQNFRHETMMLKTMNADAMAAPVVESADERVSISINVSVILDMDD
tara:strand:- start:180394 stop:181122 length:729 start_codon:yes stop_codon:yes gene_type:complete